MAVDIQVGEICRVSAIICGIVDDTISRKSTHIEMSKTEVYDLKSMVSSASLKLSKYISESRDDSLDLANCNESLVESVCRLDRIYHQID